MCRHLVREKKGGDRVATKWRPRGDNGDHVATIWLPRGTRHLASRI